MYHNDPNNAMSAEDDKLIAALRWYRDNRNSVLAPQESHFADHGDNYGPCDKAEMDKKAG